MSVVPQQKNERIGFYQRHVGPWQDAAEQIGLSAEDVAVLDAKTQAARQAFQAHSTAQQAARSATTAYYDAVAQMSQCGSGLIRKIRAAADLQGERVYALAQIDPPAKASPVPPPGKPYRFTVELADGDGSLKLAWKCKNPRNSQGTMYQIWRRIGQSGKFAFIGTSGVRSFVDDTLLAGTVGAGGVTYRIVPVRSTRRGTAADFLVFFGTDGSGTPVSFIPSEAGRRREAARASASMAA
jgi:hypothetical protein